MADDDRVPPTSQQGGGPRSIFVRNLPFDLSDKELEACFEEVGPVRECWAVRRKGQAGNSGTAFVKLYDLAPPTTKPDSTLSVASSTMNDN